METTTDDVIRQWADPEDKSTALRREYTFRVLKPFYIRVRLGPTEVAGIGDTVSLTDISLIGDLFFTGKIDPVSPGIPDMAEYLVMTAFSTVLNGEWKLIESGEVLQLNRKEAIELLRQRRIRSLEPEHFYLP